MFRSYYADLEELRVCVGAVGKGTHQRDVIKIKETRSYGKIPHSQTREHIKQSHGNISHIFSLLIFIILSKNVKLIIIHFASQQEAWSYFILGSLIIIKQLPKKKKKKSYLGNVTEEF